MSSFDSKPFVQWLIDNKIVSAVTAHTYGRNVAIVMRALPDAEAVFDEKVLRATLDGMQSRAGFGNILTSWRKYVAFAEANGVTLAGPPTRTYGGGEATVPLPEEALALLAHMNTTKLKMPVRLIRTLVWGDLVYSRETGYYEWYNVKKKMTYLFADAVVQPWLERWEVSGPTQPLFPRAPGSITPYPDRALRDQLTAYLAHQAAKDLSSGGSR